MSPASSNLLNAFNHLKLLLLVICGCLVAVAHGGIIGSGLIGTTGPAGLSLQPAGTVSLQPGTIHFPSVSSSSSNIIRGIGNIGAISAYSESVDTAFSSGRKADVRINNPDVQTGILSAGAAVPATLSYAATAPALAVSGTALAGGLTLATGPALTTSALGVGLNGVAVNGYGLGVNGYGLHNVNGLGLGLGTVKVL